MEDFAKLLHATIGLDPISIGMPSIERAVQLRMAACGAAHAAGYMEYLRATPEEHQALVEAIVVPETWFFRDPKAFSVVAEQVLQSFTNHRFHFLCVPCSTGEEPYSLAMALLDAGIAPGRFHIDAIDVSERALVHARAGIYGRNSFRGRELEFRDTYFVETAEGRVLDPAVRALVHFHRGNLLDDASIARGRTYDAIFCRNLLIYFDSPTQHRAIAALERLLAPQGLLCLGPAETGLLAPFAFTHTRIPLAFAFRKGRIEPARTAAAAPKIAIVPKPALAPVRPPAAVPRPSKPVPAVPPPAVAAAPAPDLAQAARLADEGRLEEVAVLCHAFLKQSGASAQAYYLLGLVSDAAERLEEAAVFYRKALYLNPQHHDTLLHYSVLTARRGDAQTAQALLQRARRIIEKAA
jgi:chemotaxis protein methyltransferase WspC